MSVLRDKLDEANTERTSYLHAGLFSVFQDQYFVPGIVMCFERFTIWDHSKMTAS